MNKLDKKRGMALGIVMLLLVMLSSGCTTQVSGNSAAGSAGSVAANSAGAIGQTRAEDSDAAWNPAEATLIELEGTEAAISGRGAKLEGDTLTISEGGDYVLSGDYSGNIVISAPSSATVRLILNGVKLAATQNAAIYCRQADKLILSLAEGTENFVTDAALYTYSDALNEEPDAAIFSKDDLSLNGSGSLTVAAGFHNGIGTKDNLVIASGTYVITAENHGIRGRDSVTILDGSFTIESGADGIQANNDEDASKGWIDLRGGRLSITAANDAIQAETNLTISGGDFDLNSGGGHASLPNDTSVSSKGLKAGRSLTISGGNIAIDSADDALHSSGDIRISGGEIRLSSGDDGVHADGDVTIRGGSIEILTAYEGMEAMTMSLIDGMITVRSIDDGINIAGGNDTSTDGRLGNDRLSGNGDSWLKISGGTLIVSAGRDALDVNGDAEMTGGSVRLTAATLGEGQTLDIDGTWSRSGGELSETGS